MTLMTVTRILKHALVVRNQPVLQQVSYYISILYVV